MESRSLRRCGEESLYDLILRDEEDILIFSSSPRILGGRDSLPDRRTLPTCEVVPISFPYSCLESETLLIRDRDGEASIFLNEGRRRCFGEGLVFCFRRGLKSSSSSVDEMLKESSGSGVVAIELFSSISSSNASRSGDSSDSRMTDSMDSDVDEVVLLLGSLIPPRFLVPTVLGCDSDRGDSEDSWALLDLVMCLTVVDSAGAEMLAAARRFALSASGYSCSIRGGGLV